MSADPVAKTYALLNEPKVLGAARAVLLDSGFPKNEIDDGVRELVSRVFEYLQEKAIVVETVERMCAIVRDVAYKLGVDELRKSITRGRSSAGPTDGADDQAARAESIERRLELQQAIDVVKEHATDEEKVLIQAAIEGTSQKVVAAQLDVSHGQARKMTGAMRERHTSILRRRGFAGVLAGVIAAGAGALFGFNYLYGPDHGAQNGPQPVLSSMPSPVPSAPPSATPEVPVDTSDKQLPIATPEVEKHAAELRAGAYGALQRRDYLTCKRVYEEALKIDPRGFYGDDKASDRYNVCLSKLQDLPNSKLH